MKKQLLTIAFLFGTLLTTSAQSGIINTICGLPAINGFNGDGPAYSAELNFQGDIASDAAGNLYIADYQNSRIRKIDKAGNITTVAGNGVYTFSGDGGPATDASMYYPTGVGVDNAGNVYFADPFSNTIRKVDTAGIIHIIAGIEGADSFGYNGDGIAATAAKLFLPQDVAADAAGNVYIADFGNNRIRKIDTTGIISTIAGNAVKGYSSDGGMATDASLTLPFSVALDAAGNVYITDSNRIRKISKAGIITTVAGDGSPGYSGDGGAATTAQLNFPIALALDKAGSVYVADQNNQRVRKIDTTGIISLVAGNGAYDYTGDGGPATDASFKFPAGVAIDAAGSIYISDNQNFLIREITSTTLSVKQAITDKGAINLFPNPASESINVGLPKGQYGGTLSICNATGQMVESTILNNISNEVNISGLSEGVYFVSYTTASFQCNSMFTKLNP